MSIYDVSGNLINTVFSKNGESLSGAYDVNGNYISTEWNPVSLHGKLKKYGNNIVDKNNNQYQLRGIGTHALLQYTNLHTLKMFQCLKDWGVNCIRISVYLSDFNFQYSDGQTYYGYISQPDATKAEIEKIVDLCVQVGIYAILDWHTMQGEHVNSVLKYQTEAVEFFEYYADKYADVPNVLYELQNEPYNVTQASLSAYVKAEHDAILEYATDPVMIVGCSNINTNTMVSWIENVGIYDVFYSNHVYKDDLSTYSFSGFMSIPHMMTEWSNASESSESTGDNTGVNLFMDTMFNQKISNMSWKLTDQTHVFSVLKNRGQINSPYYSNGFAEDDLTAWGKLFFDNLKRYKTEMP